MLGDLFKSGFDIIEKHEEADAIIVNTCGFIEDAKTESIEVCFSKPLSGICVSFADAAMLDVTSHWLRRQFLVRQS